MKAGPSVVELCSTMSCAEPGAERDSDQVRTRIPGSSCLKDSSPSSSVTRKEPDLVGKLFLKLYAPTDVLSAGVGSLPLVLLPEGVKFNENTQKN